MPYSQNGTEPDEKIFYIDRGDSKEVVFFIHGWYQSSRDCYGYFIDALQHSKRVIAPDLPGHGSSYKNKSGEYTLISAYRAVEELFLKVASESEHITVVGHSMGAFLAVKLALLQSESVSNLVLISPSLDFVRYKKRLQLLAKVPRFIMPLILRWQSMFDKFPFGDRKHIYSKEKGHKVPSRSEYYRIKTSNLPSFIAQKYARSFSESSVIEILNKIAQPTLVLYGSEDTLTPPEVGTGIVKMLPRGILRIVDRGGHNVQLTRKEQTLELLESFMEEHQKRRFSWKRLFRRK